MMVRNADPIQRTWVQILALPVSQGGFGCDDQFYVSLWCAMQNPHTHFWVCPCWCFQMRLTFQSMDPKVDCSLQCGCPPKSFEGQSSTEVGGKRNLPSFSASVHELELLISTSPALRPGFMPLAPWFSGRRTQAK